MADIRERLLQGESVRVQGKYTARRFEMKIVEGEMGVRFLAAFENGKRIKGQNVQWGSESAEAWIRGVRPAIGGNYDSTV